MVDRPLASHLLKIASSKPGGKPGSRHMWGVNKNSGRVTNYLIAFFLPRPPTSAFLHSRPSARMCSDLQRKENVLTVNQSAKNKRKAVCCYSALLCGAVSNFCKIQLVLSISSYSRPIVGFMDGQVNTDFCFPSLVLKQTSGQLLNVRFLCVLPHFFS